MNKAKRFILSSSILLVVSASSCSKNNGDVHQIKTDPTIHFKNLNLKAIDKSHTIEFMANNFTYGSQLIKVTITYDSLYQDEIRHDLGSIWYFVGQKAIILDFHQILQLDFIKSRIDTLYKFDTKEILDSQLIGNALILNVCDAEDLRLKTDELHVFDLNFKTMQKIDIADSLNFFDFSYSKDMNKIAFIHTTANSEYGFHRYLMCYNFKSNALSVLDSTSSMKNEEFVLDGALRWNHQGKLYYAKSDSISNTDMIYWIDIKNNNRGKIEANLDNMIGGIFVLDNSIYITTRNNCLYLYSRGELVKVLGPVYGTLFEHLAVRKTYHPQLLSSHQLQPGN